MATSKQGIKQTESTHSEELMHLPDMNASLRSKLLLSQRNGHSNGSPRTFRVEQSSILSRVRNFLPQMAEAEKKLKKEMETTPASDLDIEAVAEDEPHIEMNLALIEQEESEDETSEVEESSEESINSDIEIPTEYCGNPPITEENMIITKKRRGKKPVIEELKSEFSESITNNNKFSN